MTPVPARDYGCNSVEIAEFLEVRCINEAEFVDSEDLGQSVDRNYNYDPMYVQVSSSCGEDCPAPAETALRQRPVLYLRRVEGLPLRQWTHPHSWPTISPDDPGQDRTLSPVNEERLVVGQLLLTG